MYFNSGYLKNSRLDFKDRSRPLVVGSCGTYRLIRRPSLPTWRPRGRVDWQLIYVASGKAHFFFPEGERTVSAGNMVLFRPLEEQHYVYYGKDKTEVFWVHFTGSSVRLILRSYGFPEKEHVISSGKDPGYRELYLQMISLLQKMPDFYEEDLALLLRHLLILVSRKTREERDLHRMNEYTRAAMEQAVRYLDAHYSEEIRIEDFARDRGMSVSWLIRCFGQYCGVTPRQYILRLRTANAKDLLENSGMSVAEISEAMGFENANYFSRIFRKQTGVSPAAYREGKRGGA